MGFFMLGAKATGLALLVVVGAGAALMGTISGYAQANGQKVKRIGRDGIEYK